MVGAWNSLQLESFDFVRGEGWGRHGKMWCRSPVPHT